MLVPIQYKGILPQAVQSIQQQGCSSPRTGIALDLDTIMYTMPVGDAADTALAFRGNLME